MENESYEETPTDVSLVQKDGSMNSHRTPPEAAVARPTIPAARPLDDTDAQAPMNPLVSPPRPWGPWATIGWFVLGGILYLILSIVVVVAAGVVNALRAPDIGIDNLERSLSAFAASGFILVLITLLSAPIWLGYLALLIRWRGWRVRDYLAVNRVSWRRTWVWLTIVLAYAVIADAVTIVTGRSVVSPWMIETWKTAGSTVLLVITIVVVAPLIEEVIFRGFMYRGLAASRLGPAGAILITTLIWSLLHVQYDTFGIAQIFVIGILLGVARYRSNTLILTILMHALLNLGATVETAVKVAGMS